MDYGIQHGSTLISHTNKRKRLYAASSFFVKDLLEFNCGLLNTSLYICKMELYNRRVKKIILMRE